MTSRLLAATLALTLAFTATSAHAGSREGSAKEFKDQRTKALKPEFPQLFDPEDELDLLVGPVVTADAEDKEVDPEKSAKLTEYMVELNPSLAKFISRDESRGLRVSHRQTADILEAFQATDATKWAELFWTYSAIYMKLADNSKWREHVKFMVDKSYALLAININRMHQPEDVKVSCLAQILAKSPALEDLSNPAQNRRFKTLLEQMDRIVELGDHNYVFRNATLDQFYVPETKFKFILPHLKYLTKGAGIAATGLLPGIHSVAILPVGVAFFYVHKKLSKHEEDLAEIKEKREKALERVKNFENEAFGIARDARKRAMNMCGIVFGQDANDGTASDTVPPRS